MTGNAAGRGRPRHVEVARAGATGRDQILDAAAELFGVHGYTATSTRQIADAVGVKQASIYYHFGSKQEILVELLAGTVRPSLLFSRRLARSGAPAHAQLYALARFDVDLLLSSRWNIGVLYVLPELRSEPFAPFRIERERLCRAYGRRIAAGVEAGVLSTADARVATSLAFALAESVITMRADGTTIHPELSELVAASMLQMLGASEDDIVAAAVGAKEFFF